MDNNEHNSKKKLKKINKPESFRKYPRLLNNYSDKLDCHYQKYDFWSDEDKELAPPLDGSLPITKPVDATLRPREINPVGFTKVINHRDLDIDPASLEPEDRNTIYLERYESQISMDLTDTEYHALVAVLYPYFNISNIRDPDAPFSYWGRIGDTAILIKVNRAKTLNIDRKGPRTTKMEEAYILSSYAKQELPSLYGKMRFVPISEFPEGYEPWNDIKYMEVPSMYPGETSKYTEYDFIINKPVREYRYILTVNGGIPRLTNDKKEGPFGPWVFGLDITDFSDIISLGPKMFTCSDRFNMPVVNPFSKEIFSVEDLHRIRKRSLDKRFLKWSSIDFSFCVPIKINEQLRKRLSIVEGINTIEKENKKREEYCHSAVKFLSHLTEASIGESSKIADFSFRNLFDLYIVESNPRHKDLYRSVCLTQVPTKTVFDIKDSPSRLSKNVVRSHEECRIEFHANIGDEEDIRHPLNNVNKNILRVNASLNSKAILGKGRRRELAGVLETLDDDWAQLVLDLDFGTRKEEKDVILKSVKFLELLMDHRTIESQTYIAKKVLDGSMAQTGLTAALKIDMPTDPNKLYYAVMKDLKGRGFPSAHIISADFMLEKWMSRGERIEDRRRQGKNRIRNSGLDLSEVINTIHVNGKSGGSASRWTANQIHPKTYVRKRRTYRMMGTLALDYGLPLFQLSFTDLLAFKQMSDDAACPKKTTIKLKILKSETRELIRKLYSCIPRKLLNKFELEEDVASGYEARKIALHLINSEKPKKVEKGERMLNAMKSYILKNYPKQVEKLIENQVRISEMIETIEILTDDVRTVIWDSVVNADVQLLKRGVVKNGMINTPKTIIPKEVGPRELVHESKMPIRFKPTELPKKEPILRNREALVIKEYSEDGEDIPISRNKI